jgi:hypothetical protein
MVLTHGLEYTWYCKDFNYLINRKYDLIGINGWGEEIMLNFYDLVLKVISEKGQNILTMPEGIKS